MGNQPKKGKSKCPHCGGHKYNLDQHIKAKHFGPGTGETDPIPCPYCPRKRKGIGEHIAHFHPDRIPDHTCPRCKKVVYDVLDHCKEVHGYVPRTHIKTGAMIRDSVVEEEVPCPDCGRYLMLKQGRYGYYYKCMNRRCDIIGGAHPDGRPLGIPAGPETRTFRKAAHEVFDRLWKAGEMSRTEAYAWMQSAMGMTKDEAHIGNFGIAECSRLIRAVWDRDARSCLPELTE